MHDSSWSIGQIQNEAQVGDGIFRHQLTLVILNNGTLNICPRNSNYYYYCLNFRLTGPFFMSYGTQDYAESPKSKPLGRVQQLFTCCLPAI